MRIFKISNYVFVMLLLAILQGCFILRMNPSEPKKKQFRYYEKNYRLPPDTNFLKTNKVYYQETKDSFLIALVFFNDGFLNLYSIYNPRLSSKEYIKLNLSFFRRTETGIEKGYYTTKKDSLFFTEMSFYNKREGVFKGKISNDTLYMLAKYPYNKKYPMTRFAQQEVYYLYKE